MNNFNDFLENPGLRLNRRNFFARTSLGLGSMALASLLAEHAGAGEGAADVARRGTAMVDPAYRGILAEPHHTPKAKRIIYLFMSGGPSQLDLFDHKPLLNQMNGKDLPESVRMGQRLTGMSGNQATLPLAGSLFQFASTASRAHGSASSCPTPLGSPMISASSARSTPRRSTTTRRSPSFRPGRRSRGGRRWGPG